MDGNDIPYVAASKENNGVQKFVSEEGTKGKISKGNCITFVLMGDGAAGFTHYQEKDFIAMAGKISCGYVNDIRFNKYTGMFIASVLSQNHSKFSFKESWTGDRLLNTKFLIPVDNDGSPYWKYMEEYMKNIESKQKAVLALLNM